MNFLEICEILENKPVSLFCKSCPYYTKNETCPTARIRC